MKKAFTVLVFQENLVVWKSHIYEYHHRCDDWFQENLVVWKSYIGGGISRFQKLVSGELSSMEI